MRNTVKNPTSIILSNRVKNHIESIVKEHLYLADIKSDESELLSRAAVAPRRRRSSDLLKPTFAIVEYLLGFVALALFAFLAFGRGPASDEAFVHAFKVSGLAAAIEVAFLLARTKPANRLILGANIWLIAGATAAHLELWWWLRAYQQFGEASLFASMLLVGLASTWLSPSGFVAKLGPIVQVRRASLLLLASVLVALAVAVYFRGDVKYAAVLPVVLLSWFNRLLRLSVSSAT